MDFISLASIFILTYVLGYGTAYMNDNDVVCKEIQYTPMQDNISVYGVKDYYDANNNQYIIKDSDYIDLNKYVKGMRADLVECSNSVNLYNNDKFTIQEHWRIW